MAEEATVRVPSKGESPTLLRWAGEDDERQLRIARKHGDEEFARVKARIDARDAREEEVKLRNQRIKETTRKYL